MLCVGGGFTGLSLTLQSLGTGGQKPFVVYAIYAGFLLLFGFGVFVGIRLGEKPAKRGLLVIFYLLQVPELWSPLVSYHFGCGLSATMALLNGTLTWGFRLGADWQFTLLQKSPWGIGVNGVAVGVLLVEALTAIPRRRRERLAEELKMLEAESATAMGATATSRISTTAPAIIEPRGGIAPPVAGTARLFASPLCDAPPDLPVSLLVAPKADESPGA